MTRYTHIGILTFLVCLSFRAYSQEQETLDMTKPHSIELGVLGTGMFSSVHYGRILTVTPSYHTYASVGIGTVMLVGGVAVPHQYSYNFGDDTHFLELGIAGTAWIGNQPGIVNFASSYLISPLVGWKAMGDYLVFRVYINPIFNFLGEHFVGDGIYTTYGGIHLGYRF